MMFNVDFAQTTFSEAETLGLSYFQGREVEDGGADSAWRSQVAIRVFYFHHDYDLMAMVQ